MTTIRVAHRRRFTTIDRETINDERLSFRARGLLAWLLDKPDDWTTDSTRIAADTTEGRDAIRTTLKELEIHGYLVREKYQNNLGHWVTSWTVFERPGETEDGFPVVGAPDVGSPDAGEPGPLLNTDIDTETESATDSFVCMEVETPVLCEVMADAIAAWAPDGKRPRVGQGWIQDMDRMIRIDQREPMEIERVIRWLYTSPDEIALFWAPNIQSPKKLRAKWNQMAGQYRRLTSKPKHQSDIMNDLDRIRAKDAS